MCGFYNWLTSFTISVSIDYYGFFQIHGNGVGFQKMYIIQVSSGTFLDILDSAQASEEAFRASTLIYLPHYETSSIK